MKQPFSLVLLTPLLMAAAPGSDYPSLNDTFGTVRCIVHELADDGTRAETVAYVEDFRNRFFGGLEVIDATRCEEQELESALEGGFVLFASFHEGSTLLSAAIEPLGSELTDTEFRLRDASVPMDELRLICVGRNPMWADGAGGSARPRGVVYAAGSNSLLRGINGQMHGQRSYHLFRGGKLVAEGDYDESFEFEPTRISAESAEADVGQFFASLERVHPDLLARMGADEYVALQRKVAAQVRARLDAAETIAIVDLARALYRAAAAFGDGHTSVHWRGSLTESSAAQSSFPPFRLEYRNGEYWIEAASPPDLVGQRIVAIDGVATGDFLEPVLALCSGETEPFRASRFVHNQSFWWWFTGLVNARQEIELSLVTGDGEAEERTVATVGLDRFSKLEVPTTRAVPTQDVTYYAEDAVALFPYRAFRFSDAEKQRIDRVFREVIDRGAADLIIDIRGNGGGHSGMGDFIFTYLTSEAFRSFSKIRVKLSPDLIEGSDYWRQYADLEGLVVTEAVAEVRHEQPEAAFGGRVTLLVDNATFSSASDFAAMFRDYSIGEIIGYETGGLPTSFGDVMTLRLDHSRISYGVSHKQFFGPRPRPGDDQHGLFPDVPMTEGALAPFRDADDPVLAFTLARIASWD